MGRKTFQLLRAFKDNTLTEEEKEIFRKAVSNLIEVVRDALKDSPRNTGDYDADTLVKDLRTLLKENKKLVESMFTKDRVEVHGILEDLLDICDELDGHDFFGGWGWLESCGWD